ncbi:DUF2510 domain-containing protein [Iamia sp. SCSIO 61187]|uniref:DUF2510 domain-containing protein n=1 Tax=Iamia sp. SCSIO 61187 TaxID=2722752 RepID=UPI001C626A8A|nr:DUF2510 domain-containing protein [Iamia sp. SCSIO 61187]QYG93848.1 DUF2510 domain-containing protein [Iamia sp. SCSIO 61187]
MSDAGWHPDPHGRADRRYHDGSRWTEHVADAEGTATVDPLGADAAPGPPAGPDEPTSSPAIVIGPPPPRRPRGATPPAEATSDVTVALPAAPPTAAPATAPPPVASPPVAPDEPTTADLPPAAHADAPRTQRMGPEDVAAAAALADATGRNPRPDGLAPGAGPGEPTADRAAAQARLSVLGLIGSLVGIGLGLVALLGLPWLSGGAGVDDASYLDLREAVTRAGPDIGAIANGFIVSGAIFVVAVGGIIAVGRSLGLAAARVLATVAVLGGLAALSVTGFLAMDLDDGASGAAGTEDPVPAPAGSPVTTPTGDTIIDPATGAPVTTPDVGQGETTPAEGQEVAVDPSAAEDRLAAAAVLATAVMGVAAALGVIGLLLRHATGHLVAGVGLLVGFVWAVGAVGVLSTEDDVGDLGLGPYGVVASALLLAVSAAVPGRRRPAPS